MFRRKDEEEVQDLLNENSGAQGPVLGENSSEKSSNMNHSSGSNNTGNPSQPSSSYTGYSGRSTAEAGKSTATSYRPAAPSNPELTTSRSRVPEYRPGASLAAGSNTTAAAPKENKPGVSGSRRVLTVGHDILLKGEIATCDRLVIEGSVDAALKEVHTVEIAETGSFKGAAEIEDAEISGEFEGDLTVRNRLVIYSTGKVRGKITFGEIEIERGGELTGEIRTVAQAENKSGTKKAKTKENAEAVAA
jgi:cytoskeletal protein CcmA (bactofilin family)